MGWEHGLRVASEFAGNRNQRSGISQAALDFPFQTDFATLNDVAERPRPTPQDAPLLSAQLQRSASTLGAISAIWLMALRMLCLPKARLQGTSTAATNQVPGNVARPQLSVYRRRAWCQAPRYAPRFSRAPGRTLRYGVRQAHAQELQPHLPCSLTKASRTNI